MACSSRGMTLLDLLEDDAMTATRDRIEHLVVRIQSDFLDNPMLALTLPAAETFVCQATTRGAGTSTVPAAALAPCWHRRVWRTAVATPRRAC